MIHRQIFLTAHQVKEPQFYNTYKKVLENQWESYEELKKKQEIQLRKLIKHCVDNVPYYTNLFSELKLKASEIQRVEDLEKLPILNKDIIKQNWDAFTPTNLNNLKYFHQATGGSTGSPLQYRLSRFDKFFMLVNLYKGWGYAGYKPGDKMIFMGGSSLGIGIDSKIKTKIEEFGRNIKKFSSFDMGEKEMTQYVKIINSFKPKYIRGYASSIYFFAKWIEENNKKLYSPLACFTTAEKLYPYMREQISRVFKCEVFDAYGLNDGGISAFECTEHNGLHICTERSILEVINEKGNQIENGEGQIIATSLYNYAFPFIRYETKDIGSISSQPCSCGRGYRLLKEIKGREQEMLLTPEKKHVHGEFFTHIFWEIHNVKEFQIVQNKIEEIEIKIVPENNFDNTQLQIIEKHIKTRSKLWKVNFQFVDMIDRSKAGKFKFVINNIQ